VPLLAQVPLRDAVREAGDSGRPVALDGDETFDALARAIQDALPV